MEESSVSRFNACLFLSHSLSVYLALIFQSTNSPRSFHCTGTVRTEMGSDVNGACGQLACINEKSKGGGGTVDIEDLVGDDGSKPGRRSRSPASTKSLRSRRRRRKTEGASTKEAPNDIGMKLDQDAALSNAGTVDDHEAKRRWRQWVIMVAVVVIALLQMAYLMLSR